MRTIKQSYRIRASIHKVWEALTKPEHIDAWGAGPADMTDLPNREFSLWGGDIHGKNLDIIPDEKLVQEWFGGDWPEPSIVTINLTEGEGYTRVDLLHENVPDDEAEDIISGWKDYYFEPMKNYLENN